MGGRASSRAQSSQGTHENQGSRGRSPSQVGEAASVSPGDLAALEKRAVRLRDFERRLAAAGLGVSYEAEHARLAAECVAAVGLRRQLIERGQIKPLAGAREAAADRSYVDTAAKLCDGLEAVLKTYENVGDQYKTLVYGAWVRAE
jgi:hypothetical protein